MNEDIVDNGACATPHTLDDSIANQCGSKQVHGQNCQQSSKFISDFLLPHACMYSVTGLHC